MRKILLPLLLLALAGFFGHKSLAQQNVGIGTTTPNPNAILHLDPSSPLGFLMPKLSAADTNVLGFGPANTGIIFYDTTAQAFRYFDGANWTLVGTGSGGGAGADGRTVLNGLIDPLGGDGVDGDFFINTSTYTIFGPKTAGAWGAGTLLQGVPGADGLDGDRYATTSTTSLTIALGAQSLTVDTALAYTAAQTVIIAFDGSNFMEATVTAYNSISGVLDVNVTTITGGGTFASWTVNLAGAPGPAGAAGADGSSVLNGNIDPTGADGVDGDFFINTTSNNFFGPKTAGVWGAGTSLIGPAGAAGTNGIDGTAVLNGNIDPTGADGIDGDFFINTVSNTLFGPKTAGVWAPGISLVGPAGTNGTNGTNGIDGTAVLNGNIDPTGADGIDGDFFINTVSNTLFGPKTAGLWAPGISLVGPAGSPGAAGTNGIDGTAVLNGAVDPTGADGIDGDFFINTTSSNIFGPKTAGAWGAGTALIGAAGAAGTNGLDGSTVLNGTIDPTGADGVDGDFFINTTTDVIFGPKAIGVWPAGVPLIGPTGAAGADGDQYATNSVTNLTITLGAQTLTVDLNLAYTPGQTVIIANSGTNFMEGTVDTYNAGTGQLDVTITSVTGGGTFSVWTVNLAGAPGPAGTDGNTVLNGGIDPTGADGVDGDFFINTGSNTIFGPKTAGAWGAGIALIGPAGVAGANGLDGASVLNGLIDPTGADGADGDFFINTTSSNIFGPKTAGAWGAGTPLVGPAGAAGTNGLDGAAVLNGAIDPTGADGVDGDFFINTTSNTIFGPKTAGVWGAGTPLIGPAGTDGNTVLSGIIDPIGADGVNGDYFINTTSSTIFGPKTAGAWGAGTALIGAAGTAGLDGATILNGIIDPTGADGVDGDFFINTTSNTIFGPKTAGAWGAGTLLIGPAGNDGNTVLNGLLDPTGADGVDGDFYINTTTDSIFGPKAAGVWGTGTSLVGPAGSSSLQAAYDGGQTIAMTGADIDITSSGATPVLTIDDTNENVGIGTATPNTNYQLDVVGGDIQVNGVRIGLGTGAIANNLAIGVNALNNNPTGSSNIAIGSTALQTNTSGILNLALGNGALIFNSTGSSNTIVGHDAMRNPAGSNQNTGIGEGIMRNGATGNANTAVGYYSLRNKTGNSNSAIGHSSGIGLNGGDNNTFLGSGADAGIVTLNNATAVGANAIVSQDNSLVLGNNADVGIGTSTPANKLEVIGDAAKFDSVIIVNGAQSGYILTSDALGAASWQAPASPTAWDLLGNAGTIDGTNFIGTTDNVPLNFRVNNISAGHLETGPSANTFIGNFAGALANSNINSTAFGAGALSSLTSGDANTAVGIAALNSMVTGSGNIGIGVNAIRNATTGIDNIAIGYAAMFGATAGGDRNISVGAYSMNNSTGFDNVVIGYQGLSTAAGTKNANIAIGRAALAASTTAVNNVAIGYFAGNTNTTGNNGIYIGANSGPGLPNLFNASAIGANAIVNRNDAMVLGNNSPFYSVGIGTSDPRTSAILDLTSSTKGFLFPRVDTINVTGLGALDHGLTVFDTTDNALYVWNGSKFVSATNVAATNYWRVTGNAGTIDGTNFIGTTDNVPFNLRVNNIASGRISSSGATSYGFQSALNNTDVQTTAFGYRALGQNVSGTANTAFGYNALSQSTANSNAAFGTNALVSNVSGTQNVAMGSGALGTNFDGDNNTAIGERALQNNSDGSSNTAVGLTALFSNVSGSQNSALGWDALFSTTGGDNAALGYRAGFSNTTGNLNTFIGQNADAASGGLTNATAIGAGAIVGANNSLILGSPNVRVGIGVAVPGYDLDIDKSAAAAEVNMQIRNNAPDGSTNIYISGDAAGYLMGTGGSSIGNGLEQKFFIGNSLTGGLPFIIDNNDRIGIGTAFPTANLSIVGDSAAGGFVFAEIENSNADGLASLDFVNDANRMEIRFEGSNIADNSLIIYDDDASLARFIIDDATGNVGIGDLTPQSELDITGSVAGDFVSTEIENLDATGSASLDIWTDTRAYILGVDGSSAGSATENDFYIYDAIAGADRLVINEIGNVGIGTSSPSNRFEVIGDAAKFDSVIIVNGAQTGYVLTSNATGEASWQPLGASTFWDLTGNAGTVDGTNFIGTTDGVPLNFRINNQPAGRIDGPGTSVTALGYLAGNNGAGINNTAFGAGSMQSNTADGNSAFGSLSLLSNIAGNANTSIGYAALRNIEGVQNTAIGNAAMENSTTGADNVAVGYLSLLNNNASGNVAVGANSLENTDGQGNIGVGYAAGQNNVGGTFNIALGHNADVGAIGLNNAIAIGLNAVVDASNSVVLGGTGVDAVNVGIGNSNPSELLHLTGGTMRIENFAGNGRQILTVNNTGVVGFTDLGDSVFWAANGNDIYNKNSGNVGIGTISPTQDLHISNTGPAGILVEAGNNSFISLDAGSSANSSNVNFRVTGSTVGRIRYSHNATPASELMEFNVNGANRMIIDGSGNIAVGTSTLAVVRNYNYIEPGNSTVTTGISNSNFYNGASSKFGTVNFISADGTGEKIGSASIVNGNAGSAFSIFGSTNEVNHPGNGSTYGTRSIVNKPSAVSGFVYGDYIEMDNDGTNTGYMYYGSSIGSGGGIQYGAYMTGEDRNYFSNRVGIGTAAPSADLHVSSTSVGVARFQSTTNPLVTFYSGATYLGFIQGINDDMIFGTAPASSGDVGLYAGGSQRVTVANTGFVGIGTTTPSYLLSVNGQANLNEGIASGTALRVNGAEALWYNGTYFSWGFGGSANYFADNVGIGTTTPATVLDVQNSSTSIVPQFEIQNLSTGDAAMRFIAGNTWSMGVDNSDLDKFKIADATTVSSLTRFTMTTAGNVGLGTTTPVNNLDVEGGMAIGASYSGSIAAPLNGLIVQGGMGVGTNNPLGNFHVQDVSTSTVVAGTSMRLQNLTNTVGAMAELRFAVTTNTAGGNSKGALIYKSTSATGNGDFVFAQESGTGSVNAFQSNQVMVIKNSGRVGIGDNLNPAATLHVNSPAADPAFRVQNNGATDLMVQTDGTVTINTPTDQAYDLFVNGSAAKSSGTTWINTSDERLKNIDGKYSDGLNIIRKINPVWFRYNGKGGIEETEKAQVGIIAQDLKEIAPYTVSSFMAKIDSTDENETELYNFDFNAINYAQINAIKELADQVDQLKNDLEAKNAEIEKLKQADNKITRSDFDALKAKNLDLEAKLQKVIDLMGTEVSNK